MDIKTGIKPYYGYFIVMCRCIRVLPSRAENTRKLSENSGRIQRFRSGVVFSGSLLAATCRSLASLQAGYRCFEAIHFLIDIDFFRR